MNWAHTVATAVVTSCKGCSLDAGRGQGLLARVCAGERRLATSCAVRWTSGRVWS